MAAWSTTQSVDRALDQEFSKPRPPWAATSIAERVNTAYAHSFDHPLKTPLSLYLICASVLHMSKPTLTNQTTTYDAAKDAVEQVITMAFPPPISELDWQVLTLDVLAQGGDWVKRAAYELSHDDRELARLLMAANHVTFSRDLLAGTLDSLIAKAVVSRLSRIVHLVAEEIAELEEPDDPFGLFEDFGDPSL